MSIYFYVDLPSIYCAISIGLTTSKYYAKLFIYRDLESKTIHITPFKYNIKLDMPMLISSLMQCTDVRI